MTRAHTRPLQRRRAVLYLRQSTSKDDSISIELQEISGREHCQRTNTEVIAVIADPNRSGRTLDRRQVQEAIGYVERGEADVIVVWKWSRLARNRRDFAVVCDYVESRGGEVESSTEPVDTTTAAGRFSRGVLAEHAAFLSDSIGETWKEVHRQRREQRGLPAQGGPRFGYVLAENRKAYTVDPETGPILAEMYERYLQGHGFTRISRWLNQFEVRTLAGGTWTRDRVQNVLDSGFGAGLIIHGGRRGRKGIPITYYPGRHQAVITAEQWEQYQRQRKTRKTPPSRAEPKYFLSGRIVCEAGHPMHATPLGTKKRGYAYLCSRWSRSGGSECRCITVTRGKAERAVRAWLETLAGEVDAHARIAAASEEKRQKARAGAGQIAAKIASVEKQLTKLEDGWLADLISDTRYAAARERLEARLAELLAEQAQVDAEVVRLPTRPQIPAGLLEQWDVPEDQGGMSAADRRYVIEPLLARVEVHRPKDGPTRPGRSRTWLRVVSTWGDAFEYVE